VDPDRLSTPRGGVRAEPCTKRIRAYRDGNLILDTTQALYVWEHSAYPAYYVPAADVVRTDGLRHTRSEIDGTEYIRFEWSALDAWFEEDEEVFVHPRSPYTRVDVLPSSRHVRVEIDGVVVAETTRAHVLHETGLPPRWYIPKDDVRMELFMPTNTASQCPYKGTAEYWTAQVGDREIADIAWSYPDPLPESRRIAGLISFYNEKVDLTIDGERQTRPRTKFS
jgi:uncharacterized protein (DUF427 family)